MYTGQQGYILFSKVYLLVQRGFVRFSEVIFGSARLYSVQQGYIQSNKVILSSARLYWNRNMCIAGRNSGGNTPRSMCRWSDNSIKIKCELWITSRSSFSNIKVHVNSKLQKKKSTKSCLFLHPHINDLILSINSNFCAVTAVWNCKMYLFSESWSQGENGLGITMLYTISL